MKTTSTPSSGVVVYGIPNCDTVKKARTWLTDHAVDYTFHDFKKQGVPADLLPGWLAAAGWQTLVNRKGTTWRKLDEATRLGVIDDASATALMLATPSVIKRPVVVWGDGGVSVGFSAEAFEPGYKPFAAIPARQGLGAASSYWSTRNRQPPQGPASLDVCVS